MLIVSVAVNVAKDIRQTKENYNLKKPMIEHFNRVHNTVWNVFLNFTYSLFKRK